MKRQNNCASRREFLKKAGRVAATSALAGMAIPHVHAAENNTIQLALIGSGGRGSGAVGNAFSARRRADQACGHGRRHRQAPDRQLRESQETVRRSDRRARRPPVPGLRRLSEGDGLPPAGRRGDPHHPRGVPLGTHSAMPFPRAFTSSWRSRSRSTVPAAARCWPSAIRQSKRISRWVSG